MSTNSAVTDASKPVSQPGATGSESLFQRLGGEPVLTRVVQVFYARVLSDRWLAPVFSGVDLVQLQTHQRRFLEFAFGGAGSYSGEGMRRAHARVVAEHGIGDVHFDAVLEHLEAALHACGVGPILLCEVIGIAESIRDEVLGR
jgi:hemoglobin